MPTIMPQSELLRRAFAYVNDARKDHPETSLHQHIDDAAMRFNLSPVDAESLCRLFEKASGTAGNSTDG